MARLVLEHQGHKSEHRITGLTTIGRQSTNDVMVLAEKTSRQHARIVLAGGRFILEDLGSANGTSVNGVKVEKHVLANKDEIQIGDARLTFVDDRSANLEGQTLGNYRIHNRIGQGAMGAVYKATQISMDRIVALKVLRENLVADREFVRGFLNEARTAGKLNHPNVVRVHDFGEAGGVYYFSMEYVNGQTVEEVLKREGRIPVQRALEMTRQVTEALQHAHGLGIIHRDVKPQNIMVDRRGQVKLTDLGLARASRGSSAETGPIMGTPYYMAPELARDRRCDKRSDLYSLGASLYHMVTGRVPFDGSDAVAVINKHMNEPLVSPRKLDAGVPQPVSDLIELLMAKNPGLRPASAAELGRKIDALLEHKDVKKAPAKEDGLKLAPLGPPKKKAAPKPRPSTRKPAPVTGGPAEPKKGVRIIKVGTGSPMLYMTIGALLVAILGVAAYVSLTKKQRPPRNGNGRTSSYDGNPTEMGDGEAERKLDEARRARDRGEHSEALALARRVSSGSTSKRLVRQALDIIASLPKGNGTAAVGVSQESEADAARQLAEIQKIIDQNPQAPVFATRQLLQLVREFPGTAAAVEAARLYRELVPDVGPEVRKVLDGAAKPRASGSGVADTGDGPVHDDVPDDPPGEPPEPKIPARVAFRKACADSASGEERGDFFAARGPLVRFGEDYPNSDEALDAAEFLDKLDVRIRERLGRLYKRASTFSSRSTYAEADKLLRQIIDNDPIGDDRQLATVLLEANGAAARKTYEAVLARAKPYLDKQRFEEAGRIMQSGASRLRGTEWGGELTAAAQSAGISAAFVKRFGEKLGKSKGHSPKIKLDVGGERPTVTLVGAGPQGLALSRKGIRVVVAWKDISTKDVSRVFGVFPPSGEDRLGLGAFLFLRGERRLARRELTRAKQDAATQDRAIALLEQLDARAKVRRIDFSNYEQSQALRLEGSWRIRGGRLTHGGSRVGTATLRGVDYRANGFHVTFMVSFLEDAGAIEVQLGPSSGNCVWFSLGSAGYQARMQLGGRSADVQDDWRMVSGKVIAVSCRIEGDRLNVQAAGKGLKPLKARGLGGIAGPVVFRAQGGRLAIDDIVTRQAEKDGG
jgi:serine/threonine-protein kinase